MSTEPPLSSLIEEKTNKLLEQAELTGQVQPVHLRELQRLIRLSQIQKSGKRKQSVARTPLILIAVLTMAICSVLVFKKIASAEIALDAEVSNLSFQTSGSTTLNLLETVWPLSSFGVESAIELTLPTGDAANPKRQLSGASAFAKWAAASEGSNNGHVVLNSLLIAPGTRVDFSRREGDDGYELRLTPAPGQSVSVKAAVVGPTELNY